ncbi:MAG: TIGR00730 family Rossman fold protein [Proteobacteria bacterium]|nr:TIGR00730 family Rossman fold protein [Pseudomonadota bacterium]
MTQIQTVCVYCGSSSKTAMIYQDTAIQIGELIAQNGFHLVYGGGRLGLMGLVADGVLRYGGKAFGFIPEYLETFEGGHDHLTELHIVDSMHTRKWRMSQMGDAFLVLPGGFGTLDELFEILTWRQIKLHNKPIILVNVNKYWDPLISLIKQVTEHQFAKKEDIDLLTLVDSPEEAITVLHSFRQTCPSYQSGINTIKSF